MKRASALVLTAAALVLAPAAARAAEEPANPSVFSYAGNGFLMGGMVGLSAGYLVARDGGFQDDDWRPLAFGAGVGALAGGALGLGLGVVDMARETPGYGAYILRDTMYGAGFGAVAGAITGGLAALSTGKGEHVALGAAPAAGGSAVWMPGLAGAF